MDKLYGLVLLHSLFLKFNDYNDIIGSMMQIQGEWVTRRFGKTNKPANPVCVNFLHKKKWSCHFGECIDHLLSTKQNYMLKCSAWVFD